MEYPFIKCLNPKKIVNPYTHESMTVSCGKCKACLLTRSSRLSFQCDMEANCSRYVVFVTLTYDEKFLPRFSVLPLDDFIDENDKYLIDIVDVRTGEVFDTANVSRMDMVNFRQKTGVSQGFGYLSKRDLQLFIKRFRFYASKISSSKVRYFACGEYGPVHFRPHYHLLFFIEDKDIYEACDEIVLKSWKYGRTDVQAVSGNAANYVASYVNGGCTLPSILKRGALRPFCLHSWRLGQKFFFQERRKVYDYAPDAFIRRSILLDGKFKEFDVWRSCYAYFYPKCKGFASKSTQWRTYSYRLYDTGRLLFPYFESAIELARAISYAILMHYNFLGLRDYPVSSEEDKKVLEYLRYFVSSCNFHSVYASLSGSGNLVESEEYQRFVYRVYLELSISKHFLTYVCDKVTTFEINRKVKLIENFYSRLDYLHLTDWFSSQQLYFEGDLACDDDIYFFYDNVRFTPCGISDLPVYKLFDSYVFKRFSDSVKHKKLNDINRLLFSD